MSPRPVTEWPDRPVDESTLETDEHPPPVIEDLDVETPVQGIWARTQADAERTSIPDAVRDTNAVVDLVVETPERYHLYSYVHHDGTSQWVCYDPESKGTERAHRFEERLDRYSFYSGPSQRV